MKACRRRRWCASTSTAKRPARSASPSTDINDVISTHLGSIYINDFMNRGRMQRVIVQADEANRMHAEDILTYSVRNRRGEMVPLSAFAPRMAAGRRRSSALTAIPRCA